MSGFIIASIFAVPLGILMGGFKIVEATLEPVTNFVRYLPVSVLIPARLPGVMDTPRVTLGWAWTYLVVAELVAANKGLGYFILNSMRGLFTDQIFLGIMVIGLLGLITDHLFKLMRNWLLPWAANP